MTVLNPDPSAEKHIVQADALAFLKKGTNFNPQDPSTWTAIIIAIASTLGYTANTLYVSMASYGIVMVLCGYNAWRKGRDKIVLQTPLTAVDAVDLKLAQTGCTCERCQDQNKPVTVTVQTLGDPGGL